MLGLVESMEEPSTVMTDILHRAVARPPAFRNPGRTDPPVDAGRADVRFRTRDHDFTDRVTSGCSNVCGVRSVGTHEAGHPFGPKDVHGSHGDLTTYGGSIGCPTRARTPGRGD